MRSLCTLLIAGAMLLGTTAGAQHTGTSFTLNQPIVGGQHSYTATDFVRLTPGFSYQPQSNTDYFRASISDYVSQVVTPPVEGASGGPSPEDDGLVGRLSDVFDVGENGSFTYSLNLDVPSGRAGMTPSINLTYNSGVSDGPLGLGWSIGAISLISHTALTYHHDGTQGFHGSEFSTFALMLDGTRLIQTGNNEYRKEIDDYTRIRKIFPGSGHYFEVKTKSGLTYEYGKGMGSVHRGITDQSPSFLQVYAYYLYKVSDNYGNQITYNYSTNQNTGEIYLLSIEYLNNKVVFEYESVDDITYNYFCYNTNIKGALSIQNSKVLNKVICKQDDGVLWEYSLNYETRNILNDENNPIRLLSSVQKQTGNGEKINKTRFTWEDAVNYGQSTPISYNLNLVGNGRKTLYYGNFFGNASKDLIISSNNGNIQMLSVYRNDSGQFIPAGDVYGHTSIQDGSIIIGDFNGDGFDDFVHFEYRSNILYFHVYINMRNGTFSWHPISVPTNNQDLMDIIPGDFNGDGLTDIMFRNAEYGEIFFMVGDANNATNGHLTGAMWSPRKFIPPTIALTPGHFTGSNRTELIGRGNIETNNWKQNIYTLHKNVEQYTLDIIEIDNSIDLKGSNVSTVDVNGDGKSDLIKIRTSEVGYSKLLEVDIYACYGSDFIDKGTYSVEIASESQPEFHSFYITKKVEGDFNGDGRSDIIVGVTFVYEYEYIDPHTHETYLEHVYVDYLVYLYSNKSGDGFSSYVTEGTLSENIAAVDLSGNGAHDLVKTSFYGNSPGSYLMHQPDRYKIKRVVNGVGKWIEVDYSCTSNKNTYQGSTGTYAYPNSALTVNFAIVSAIREDNGYGSFTGTTFTYKGGVMNYRGLGLLGFRSKVSLSTEVDHIEIQTAELQNEYPLFLPMSSIKRVYSTGKLISEKSYEYEIRPTVSNKTLFVSPATVFEKFYEPDGSAPSAPFRYDKMEISSFDAFGNPLVIISQTGKGGYTFIPETIKTTTNSYLNYTNNGRWVLGRLSFANTVFQYGQEDAITKSVAFTYYQNERDFGMLEKEIVEPDSLLSYTKTYTYDDFGNTSSVTLSSLNAIDNRINYSEFDPDAAIPGVFLTKLTNSIGHTSRHVYDYTIGKPIKSFSSNELMTIYQYDGYGKLLKTIDPSGNQAVVVLRWVQEDDELAPQNSVFYSWEKSSTSSPVITYFNCNGVELRRITSGFNGAEIFSDKIYNVLGQLIKQSAPYYNGEPIIYQSFEYDKLGRILTSTTPDSLGNAVTVFEYDGLISSVTDPPGKQKVMESNSAGWLITSTDALGNKVINSYYSDGKTKSIAIDGVSNSKRDFQYDIMGNLTKYMDSSQGTLKYEYNPFGELTKLTTPMGITNYPMYDKLGRLLRRITPEATSTWEYDRPGEKGLLWEEKLVANGNIKHKITYTYDHENELRLHSIEETIGSESFIKSLEYDVFGRPVKQTFPSGYAVNFSYNPQGYQNKIIEAGNGNVLWEAKHMNKRNQFTEIKLGQNITQFMEYDQLTGRIKKISSANLQSNNYTWDKIGNLKTRNSRHNITEQFEYDNLNRLTNIKHNGVLMATHQYDAIGNITFKSDVGNYQYANPSNPYKLTSIDNRPSTINTENQEIVYNSFNKVAKITEKDPATQVILRQLDLGYGVGNQRIIQQMQIGQSLTTKYYVGGDYEVEVNGSQINRIHYIFAPSGLVAIIKRDDQNNNSINYVLNDHLGSAQVMASAAGQMLEEFSYDPWGMRRNPLTLEVYAWDDMPATGIDYGFTGHEHLDIFMLVNMNGRMYDPVLGRFLTPDPVLQFPNYTQGLNPYAYTLNNPLRFIDPSGYSLNDNTFFGFYNGVGSTMVTMAFMAAGLNPATLIAVFIITAINVTTTSMAKGAPIQKALQQGITAGALTVVSAIGSARIGRVFEKIVDDALKGKWLLQASAHATFNGTLRLAQGGKFEHGFASGFVSSLGGSLIEGRSMRPGIKISMAAIVGGTAESLGGGKFANGAVTGAFVMMLNHLGEPQTRPGRSPLTKEQLEVLKDKIKMATLKHRASWAKYDETMGAAPYWEESFDIGGVEYGDVYSAENLKIWLGKETLNVDIDYFPNSAGSVTNNIDVATGADWSPNGRLWFYTKGVDGQVLQINFHSREDYNKYFNFIKAHDLKKN